MIGNNRIIPNSETVYFSDNSDVLEGVSDNPSIRPQILDPATGDYRIFSLEPIMEVTTSLSPVLDGHKIRAGDCSVGYYALAHLMRADMSIVSDNSQISGAGSSIGVITIHNDFTFGKLAQKIVGHNEDVEEPYRLSIPLPVPHLGYDSKGGRREGARSMCVAAFMACILASAIRKGSDVVHALRPIGSSNPILSHDFHGHLLGSTYETHPELFCNMSDTERLRAGLEISIESLRQLDGAISTTEIPDWLKYWGRLADVRAEGGRSMGELIEGFNAMFGIDLVTLQV